ncbi:hypothetical protein E4T56_gene5469, partial [Termitomyces sp. T112]
MAPTPSNSKASLANSNGTLANSNTFSAAFNASPAFPEPLGPSPTVSDTSSITKTPGQPVPPTDPIMIPSLYMTPTSPATRPAIPGAVPV